MSPLQIPAKPTTYQGITFRSRTEARWAVFLDAIHKEWHYESYTIRLPFGASYTPDFSFGMEHYLDFMEVKPAAITDEHYNYLSGIAEAIWLLSIGAMSPRHDIILAVGSFYGEEPIAGYLRTESIVPFSYSEWRRKLARPVTEFFDCRSLAVLVASRHRFDLR